MNKRSSIRIATMHREDLERRVVEIVAASLCIETGKLRLRSACQGLLGLSYEELGADRLDLYAIMMDLEEELGVSIPDRVAQRFVTIADTVEFIATTVCRKAETAGPSRWLRAHRAC